MLYKMKTPKPTFTLLAFHYFIGNQQTSHPGFKPFLKRLESESVRVDQGVYILRSREDAALLDECLAYLSVRRRNHMPWFSLILSPNRRFNTGI